MVKLFFILTLVESRTLFITQSARDCQRMCQLNRNCRDWLVYVIKNCNLRETEYTLAGTFLVQISKKYK